MPDPGPGLAYPFIPVAITIEIVLGRFCVWLALSREPELLTSVIKASPFTMDLILAPPNHLTATVLATQHTETDQEINSTEEIFELAQL